MKNTYSLTELEAAINYWRSRAPSTGEEQALSRQTAALAEPYANLIFTGQRSVDSTSLTEAALTALQAWDDSNLPISGTVKS